MTKETCKHPRETLLLLVGLLALLGLTACSGTPTPGPSPPSPTAIYTSTALNTPTPEPTSTETVKPMLTPTLEIEPFPPNTPSVLLFRENGLFRASLSGDVVLPLFTSPERAPLEAREAWRGLSANPPHISPDGRWMVERGERSWRLVDLRTGEAVAEGAAHRDKRATSWAPDSRRFAYLDPQQRLCIYDLATETVSCPFEEVPLWDLYWAPDGAHIAALESDEVCCSGNVWLITLPGGESERIGRHTGWPTSPPWGTLAWTPGGSDLLIKNADGTPAELYTPASGRIRTLPAPAVSLSPDGDFVLYDLAADAALAVGPRDGEDTWTLPRDPDCGDPLALHNWAWSPAGHRLAYVTPCPDGTSTLYLVDAAREELLWSRALPDFEGRILLWTADGEHLLLDDYRYDPPSPIWRLSVESEDAPEEIVERGLLVDVVSAMTSSASTAHPTPTPIAVAELCPPASSDAAWACQELEITVNPESPPGDTVIKRRYSITEPPIGALEVDVWGPSDADLTTWLEKQNAPNLFPVQEPNGAVGGHPAIFWVTDPPHSSFNALVSDGTYIYKIYYIIICHEDGLPAVRQMLDSFRFAGEPAVSAEIPKDVWRQALTVCE